MSSFIFYCQFRFQGFWRNKSTYSPDFFSEVLFSTPVCSFTSLCSHTWSNSSCTSPLQVFQQFLSSPSSILSFLFFVQSYAVLLLISLMSLLSLVLINLVPFPSFFFFFLFQGGHLQSPPWTLHKAICCVANRVSACHQILAYCTFHSRVHLGIQETETAFTYRVDHKLLAN